jgi:hypothetical protein
MRDLFSPHPHKYLLFIFLMIAVLIGVRWNLSVVLICICFMARDGGHFSMCYFWPLGILPLKEFHLVQLPTSFLIVEEFSFLSSLYILVISPLSDV